MLLLLLLLCHVMSGTCARCRMHAARLGAPPPTLISSSSINGAAATTTAAAAADRGVAVVEDDGAPRAGEPPPSPSNYTLTLLMSVFAGTVARARQTNKYKYTTRKVCSGDGDTPFTMPLIRSRDLIAATSGGSGDPGHVEDDDDQQAQHGHDYNEGEIDPRSVFWLASSKHRDGERCKMCPNCVCLSIVRTLTQIATHPCLLQVDLTKHSLVDAKDQTKKEFLEKAIPEDLVEEMGGVFVRQNHRS